MSYILEALKKADQERMVGKVPDLDSGHESLRPPRRRSRWFWILGILLIINGVLVAALMWRHDGTENGSGRAAARPLPAGKAGKLVPPPATLRPPVVLTPRQPAARTSKRAYIPPAPRRPAATGITAAPAASPALPPAARTVPEVAVHNPPVPVPQVRHPAPAAPVAMTSPAESTGTLPDWDDLPLEFRSGFTVPHIDVHVYDTNPQNRFILVNLKKFREGDRLESGALLEKITSDGVQLLFQGKQFIYRQ